MHLLGDGHLHITCVGQLDGGIRREHAFCDLAVHARDNLGKFPSTSEFNADIAVPREFSRAGEDKITETGESGHGFRSAAACDHEAGHLCKAPGDESGNRVMPQAQTVADASRDRNNVLQ